MKCLTWNLKRAAEGAERNRDAYRRRFERLVGRNLEEKMEEIYPKVTDEGGMGARLDVFSKPRGCPGLGGWKRTDSGWFTRVKGADAARILHVSEFAPDNTVTLVLNGDRITDIAV